MFKFLHKLFDKSSADYMNRYTIKQEKSRKKKKLQEIEKEFSSLKRCIEIATREGSFRYMEITTEMGYKVTYSKAFDFVTISWE